MIDPPLRRRRGDRAQGGSGSPRPSLPQAAPARHLRQGVLAAALRGRARLHLRHGPCPLKRVRPCACGTCAGRTGPLRRIAGRSLLAPPGPRRQQRRAHRPPQPQRHPRSGGPRSRTPLQDARGLPLAGEPRLLRRILSGRPELAALPRESDPGRRRHLLPGAGPRHRRLPRLPQALRHPPGPQTAAGLPLIQPRHAELVRSCAGHGSRRDRRRPDRGGGRPVLAVLPHVGLPECRDVAGSRHPLPAHGPTRREGYGAEPGRRPHRRAARAQPGRPVVVTVRGPGARHPQRPPRLRCGLHPGSRQRARRIG